MSVELANEIWNGLKRYINTVDRAEAAEDFVGILVDNDIDPEDIKDVFKGDNHIKNALAGYINSDEEEYEEEEFYDDEDYEDDD